MNGNQPRDSVNMGHENQQLDGPKHVREFITDVI